MTPEHLKVILNWLSARVLWPLAILVGFLMLGTTSCVSSCNQYETERLKLRYQDMKDWRNGIREEFGKEQKGETQVGR